METHNIISTPAITGNVGSCKTEVVTVTSTRESWWYKNKTDIATNSCTGEVSKYEYWETTGAVPAIFLAGALLLLLAFAIIMNSID